MAHELTTISQTGEFLNCGGSSALQVVDFEKAACNNTEGQANRHVLNQHCISYVNRLK